MAELFSKLRPALMLVIVLIVGAVLGYVWGASSVQVVDTGLWQLQTSYQGIFVQAVADAYALDGNDALAADRLSFLCQQNDGLTTAFAEAQLRYGANPSKSANLDQLRTLVDGGQVVQNSAVAVCNLKPIGFGPQIGRLMWLLLLLGAGGILGYGYLTTRGKAAPAAAPAAARPAPPPAAGPAPAAPPPGQAEVTQPRRTGLPLGIGKKREEETAPRSAAAAGAVISRTAEKTDYMAVGTEPPIVQFMTTYLHGDDLYDDSFSIETSSGEFLGETGVGISEVVGTATDAKSVTALEVWLFDKNDIRTVTKVLMSDHAFNDDALRAKLAPKGEAALMKPGEKFSLDTATLRVQARIVDMAYKADAAPTNGVVQRVTLELAAWKRDNQGARPGSPSGLPPFPGSGTES